MSEFKRSGIVWVLGAGFSKFLGAPLLNELLTERSLKRVRAIYREDKPVLAALKDADGITELFSWGAHSERAYWENAEEFLEQLDFAVADNVRKRTFAAVLDEFTRPAFKGTASSLGAMAGKMKMSSGVMIDVDKFAEGEIEALRFNALRLAAAEVEGFIEGSDPLRERWAPYRAWGKALQQNDTILTFNYDLLLETLNQVLTEKLGWFGVSTGHPTQSSATVVKMHGSVDWLLQDDNGDGKWDRIVQHRRAALSINMMEKMGMATPGPRKRALIDGVFGPLWKHAEAAIANAEAIVFVGYRMPPTDAGTKQWFVEQLRAWVAASPEAIVDHLPIHVVLGPADKDGHADRLTTLFQNVGSRFDSRVWFLGAEDFLGLCDRSVLNHGAG